MKRIMIFFASLFLVSCSHGEIEQIKLDLDVEQTYSSENRVMITRMEQIQQDLKLKVFELERRFDNTSPQFGGHHSYEERMEDLEQLKRCYIKQDEGFVCSSQEKDSYHPWDGR